MFKVIRSRWTVKILSAILVVVMLMGIIHTAAMNLSIRTTFNRHFGRMGEGMPAMMGGQRGVPLYENFRAAVNDSLVYSAVAAFFIAIIASIILSRLITQPVKALTQASQHLALGDYHQRIPAEKIPPDELGQLASSFNQMAEKLEETEMMRRQLIGDISHELRTPLTVIKGSMEGLMDGVLAPTEETYTQIYKDADRLQRLVEDLQELSRVEAIQFALNLQPISLPELIREAADPLHISFDKKGVALHLDLEKNLPGISADRDRLVQILWNLLDNALHFTAHGGQVLISAHRDIQGVRIVVQDNGAGIEAHHLPHIFERFYRADPSRSRVNGGGSGIGLTICKTLVEAHGGKIWVESDGKGKGSAFIFTLPVKSYS